MSGLASDPVEYSRGRAHVVESRRKSISADRTALLILSSHINTNPAHLFLALANMQIFTSTILAIVTLAAFHDEAGVACAPLWLQSCADNKCCCYDLCLLNVRDDVYTNPVLLLYSRACLYSFAPKNSLRARWRRRVIMYVYMAFGW